MLFPLVATVATSCSRLRAAPRGSDGMVTFGTCRRWSLQIPDRSAPSDLPSFLQAALRDRPFHALSIALSNPAA